MRDNFWSLDEYGEMLSFLLNKGYEFKQFDGGIINSSGTVYLRHDIDLCLSRALTMARFEKQLGISSTYYIMVRGAFYTLNDFNSIKVIEEIVKLGHTIGLHFDFSLVTNETESAIKEQILSESEMLSTIVGEPITSISFHRPISLEFFKEFYIEGLTHTYEARFIEKLEYVADSTGRWRHASFWENEAINDHKSLHLLIHPIWWVGDEMDSSFVKLLDWKKVYLGKFYDNLEKNLGAFWNHENLKEFKND